MKIRKRKCHVNHPDLVFDIESESDDVLTIIWFNWNGEYDWVTDNHLINIANDVRMNNWQVERIIHAGNGNHSAKLKCN